MKSNNLHLEVEEPSLIKMHIVSFLGSKQTIVYKRHISMFYLKDVHGDLQHNRLFILCHDLLINAYGIYIGDVIFDRSIRSRNIRTCRMNL